MLNKKYIVRACISPFVRREKEGKFTLACLFQSSRLITSFRLNTLSLKCFKLLDGKNTIRDIVSRCRVSKRELLDLVVYLEKEHIVERVNHFRPRNGPRYRRQLNFFASFETNVSTRAAFQKKLETSQVVILGLGGIGSWVAESLVRAGVGRFILIDPDNVTASNLPRQTLYQERDLGKSKVRVAANKLRLINSKVTITGIKRNIVSASQLIPIIKKATLVVNCADQPDISITNRIVSKACFSLKIPHILCGGYDGHLSFVGQTVIPHKTACWECYVSGKLYEKGLRGFKSLDITAVSEEGGTLAPIASITANIHALEAIKVLTGYAKPSMINCKAELDFNSLSLIRTKIPRFPQCRLCRIKKPRKEN